MNNASLYTNYTLGPAMTLETSFNPFAAGSSLNHVDGEMYQSTADFLMRYATPKGKTLKQLVAEYGNSSDPNYGPFGPGLRYILAGIGYKIRGGIPQGGSVPDTVHSGASGTSTTSAAGSTPKSGASVVTTSPVALAVTGWVVVMTLWVFGRLGFGGLKG